jgi:hypothetical protein
LWGHFRRAGIATKRADTVRVFGQGFLQPGEVRFGHQVGRAGTVFGVNLAVFPNVKGDLFFRPIHGPQQNSSDLEATMGNAFERHPNFGG